MGSTQHPDGRIIAVDNDGGDIFFAPGASYEEFITARLAPLADSGATTLLYTTQSSGFSVFSHPTKYGSLYENYEPTYPGNCAAEIIRRGSDCMKYASRFARENRLEIYWNFRMNDTHDNYSEENTYAHSMFSRNRLKHEHPEYMVGTKENRPKIGAWTAVDYAREEIRSLAALYVKEILEGWDVDGISLDFYRHPIFFKETANGLPAEKEHVGLMTEMVGRMRAEIENHGKKLWIRVPDSVEYALYLGLDIEAWLKNGWIDVLCTTGYLHLNDWKYTAALAHRYGVKAVASIDETRIRDQQANRLRLQDETWIARCAEAYAKDMDGVMLFNLIVDAAKQDERYRRIIGSVSDEEKLIRVKKRFFASYRGYGAVAGGAPDHSAFQKLCILNPASPTAEKTEHEVRVGVYYADSEAKEITVVFDRECRYTLSVNGEEYSGAGSEARIVCRKALTGEAALLIKTELPVRITDAYIETGVQYE